MVAKDQITSFPFSSTVAFRIVSKINIIAHDISLRRSAGVS
ncbi:hypothetical protein [Mixta theicola]|nr:hypothetical protein [Mixta theicola]